MLRNERPAPSVLAAECNQCVTSFNGYYNDANGNLHGRAGPTTHMNEGDDDER